MLKKLWILLWICWKQQEIKSVDCESFDPLINFCIEQLKLCFLPKSARHYSPDLLINSFLWHMTSNKLYLKLRDLFIPPCDRRLRTLCSDQTVTKSLVDIRYLHKRIEKLTMEERTCVLIIDEIYTAKKIEYSNGQFYGVNDDGDKAKTVLAFMIQSLMCKYRDVVLLIPTTILTVDCLRSYFDYAMKVLDELVLILAVSMDNSAVNR